MPDHVQFSGKTLICSRESGKDLRDLVGTTGNVIVRVIRILDREAPRLFLSAINSKLTLVVVSFCALVNV
jgi:hypothetical protein